MDLHGLQSPAERTKTFIAWAGNVFCCTSIVFANKVLMSNTGYKFHFATTLSAMHFLVSGAAVLLTKDKSQSSAGKGGGKLPLRDLIFFTVVADVSIIALNLSLLLNPVSVYQIAKLLVIPFVCLVELLFFGSVFSRQVVATILMVVLGVGIVTVESLSFDGTPLGLSLAGLSVVASGSQQILVRSMQQAHGLTPNELLGSVAPAQAVTLLLMGPFVDKLVSNDWVFDYSWSAPAIMATVLSCALAVGVNVTQFMCLGRLSAVFFQVLGHSKTILVLLGSWTFMGESPTPKKLAGMVLAVMGMMLYGRASMGGAGKQARPAAGAAGGSSGSSPDGEDGGSEDSEGRKLLPGGSGGKEGEDVENGIGGELDTKFTPRKRAMP